MHAIDCVKRVLGLVNDKQPTHVTPLAVLW